MRVWQLVRNYYPKTGGNQNQCKLLSEHLVKEGCQVTILTQRYSLDYKKNECINGLIIHRINSLNTYKPIITRFLFFKKDLFPHFIKVIWNLSVEYSLLINFFFTIIRNKNKYDILHIHQCNWLAFWGLAAAKISNKKCLIKDATLGGFEELKYMAFSKYMRKYLINYGIFIAISKDIRIYLINQGVPINRIYFVPNGTLIPEKSNFDNKKKSDILFIGNFWQGQIKGLDILIEAMVHVVKFHPSIKLKIIGEGPVSNYSQIISQRMLDKNIEFLGKQNVIKYFNESIIFVLPSRSEGMSNSLMEAMAYGMPCISTEVSGSVDLIENDVNGILVQKENPKKLADSIVYMIQNEERALQMGNNARKTIEENYTMDIITSKYIHIYESLIYHGKL